MRVLVVRHGKARRESDSGRDEDRDLSPRGERQAEYLASVIAGLRIPPARVLSSPALRARRTAEPIAKALGLDVVLNPALRVDEPPTPVLESIVAMPASVAIVGHLPQLGRLLAILLCGATTGELELRTGTCVEIEFEPGAMPVPGREVARYRLDD